MQSLQLCSKPPAVLRRRWKGICHTGLLLLILLSSNGLATQGAIASGQDVSQDPLPPTRAPESSTLPLASLIYLPIIVQPEAFSQDTPIWVHAGTPAAHEVALFRHEFTLAQALDEVEIFLFADTRYEVWLNGNWVGRGPARFSRSLREYDVYSLGTLPAGKHLLAVLVQWAPNNRRSESVTPMLRGHLEGKAGGRVQIIARTGPQWQAQLSDAWKQDAAPVHSWGLIGPTELLDLRQLPADWNRPSFQGENWPPAVARNILQADFRPLLVPRLDLIGAEEAPGPAGMEFSLAPLAADYAGATYQRRSIPLLVNEPITPNVIESGTLSTGKNIGEVAQPASGSYELVFSATHPVTITIEVLSENGPNSNDILLNTRSFTWQETDRLDVYRAFRVIKEGSHKLTFKNIPPEGVTFAVSTDGLTFTEFPFQQGIHAGRRLLLAEAQRVESNAISVATSGLSMNMPSPPAYLILDLGRTVYGRLEADFSGPAGTVIDMGWDERLSTDEQRPLPYPGSLHPQWNQVDSWVLDGNTRTVTTIDARAGRYVLVAVWGQGLVQIGNLRVFEERYPVELKGAFKSSSTKLDRIWEVGATTLYPNMSDAYSDPWRERGQWWGDAYVTDQANRAAFGDTGLVRRGVTFMSNTFSQANAPGMAPNNNGMNMVDYTMLWVHSLDELTTLTGDMHLLNETYPKVRQFLNYLAGYEHPETGLLDLPQTHWSQSAYVEGFGYASRYGQSTAVNAMYYSTLLSASRLAYRQGETAYAYGWELKAADIRQAVNTYLYDAQSHRYLTHIYQEKSYPPTVQSQAWALAYGLPPEEDVDQAASALIGMVAPNPAVPNIDIYGMYWLLEALGKSGRAADGLPIIEKYYGRMLDLGATTWWERFEANLYPSASLSHGWGASPTWFLTTYVLGARQLGPKTWVVKPDFDSLTHAAGALPFQDGVLTVSWEHPTCQEYYLELDAPNGSSGEFILSPKRPGLVMKLGENTIWENGAPTTPGVKEAEDGIHVALNSGTYTFTVTADCSSNFFLPAP